MFAKAGAQGFLGMAAPEEYGGGGVAGLPVQRRDRGGDPARRRERRRARMDAAQRHLPAVLPDHVHRRAEGALDPRHLLGRAHHCDRDDRAGHRLGPRGHEHDRDPRRRPLRRERFEDVHHERHQRGPRRHRGEDRPDAAARGHEPDRPRARHGRASSAAATSTRSACTPRTPPSCSSTTSPSRSRTCWARRDRASSASSTSCPRSASPSRSPGLPRPGRRSTSRSNT